MKQLEISHVKLKSESLNLNFLQEKCAELEQEKKILQIELDAVQKEANTRCNLLDSELNTVSSIDECSGGLFASSSLCSFEINMKSVKIISNKPMKIERLS